MVHNKRNVNNKVKYYYISIKIKFFSHLIIEHDYILWIIGPYS